MGWIKSNISTLISQLELPAPQEILLVSKIPTDVSLLSGTGDSVTTERRIPRKSNTKPPSMSPPRKDPITNQDSTKIITQQYPILTPLLLRWPTEYKPFIDDTHFKNET